ncbi:CREB/ATF bZIP transcription factor-like [Branchiostoma lanceolatum]|uniref:CREB/ATF bZIP transcription factor-like n=1 Tax=Branchiostoma lanceolatum TaxID=7740 RepID=UPI00345722B4
MASPASSTDDYASDADQLFAELQSSDFNFDNLNLTKTQQDEEEAIHSIFGGEETEIIKETRVENVNMSQVETQKSPKGKPPPMILKVQLPVLSPETIKNLTKRSTTTKQAPTKAQLESEEARKKNAEAARQNRLRKKHYVQDLEGKVDTLAKENTSLKKENSKMQTAITSLEEELEYLKSVLANQSSLANLLKNIDTTEGVSLTTSFPSNRKRKAGEKDHDYSKGKKKKNTDNSGGVCLHVNKDQVSLEFCSKCAHMAVGGERQ